MKAGQLSGSEGGTTLYMFEIDAAERKWIPQRGGPPLRRLRQAQALHPKLHPVNERTILGAPPLCWGYAPTIRQPARRCPSAGVQPCRAEARMSRTTSSPPHPVARWRTNSSRPRPRAMRRRARSCCCEALIRVPWMLFTQQPWKATMALLRCYCPLVVLH